MRKGLILINVIIIMIMLNIMALSVFTMNRNLVNSRVLSVRNKEKSIYIKSKINIVDYKIKDSFKQAIEEFKIHIDKDDKTSNSLLKTLTNNKIQNIDTSDFAGEIEIVVQKTITNMGSYDIVCEMYFYDEETRRSPQYLSYEIAIPQLTDEDREDIKSGDTNKVFEKYKKSLISKKIVY